MNGQQESDQQIHIKLSGINRRSLVDLAQKMDTSVVSEIYTEQISDLQKSNVADISRGEVLDKSNRLSQETSYFMNNLEIKNKCFIQSEQELDTKKNGFQKSVKYDPNLNNEQESPRKKAETLANSFNINPRYSQVGNNPRGKQQITIKKPLGIIQSMIPRKSQVQSRISVSVKKPRWSGYHTTEKITNIFTYIKPLLTHFIDQNTMFGRYKKLSDYSRKLIADKSDSFQFLNRGSKQNIFQTILVMFVIIAKFIEKLFFMMLEKIPLFNPENKLRIMINALIVCYNCFYLLIISFNIFFQANIGQAHHSFHYIATAAWVSEMIIQMNTATYHDGDFITDRKVIFQIYLKEYFFFEILPLIFEGKSSPNTTINILLHLPLLLKLKGMSIILSKLEFLILQHLHKPYIMQICKQLISILLLIHLMACSYVTLAKFEQNILQISDTWLNQSQIQQNHENWWSAYIEAQLWAFYTMGNSYSSSVVTSYEYAFTSFWVLISCILFAYNITALGNILQDINSISENYKKDLNVLNRYMKRKKIDIELQRVMNSHLVKQYEQETSVQFEAERDALCKLSIHMRNKLVTESNKHLLSQFSFFNIFSQQTLLQVYQIMVEESYSEGQIIQTFEINTLDNFIYLILQGSVDIIQYIPDEQKCDGLNGLSTSYLNYDERKKKGESKTDTQKVIYQLKEGQQFGEYEFFVNSSIPYIAQSQKQAVVVKISRNKFIQIVSQNKYDYQKFMEIKERISFNNEFNVIKQSCYICKSQDHHFLECNQTHFPKLSHFTIKKHNYSQHQNRSPYERIDKKHQKYVIKLISQQLMTEIEEFDEQISPSKYEKGDDTSICKESLDKSLIKMEVKLKQLKISNQTPLINKAHFSIQLQIYSSLVNQKEKSFEEPVNLLRSIGSQVANANHNRRSSFRASVISKKQHNKAMENFQDMVLGLDRKETIEEKQTPITEEKQSQKNSLNNLSELSPKSNIQAQIHQSIKSQNLVTSLRAIRRSIQYNNNQVVIPYENTNPDIDFMNSALEMYQKYSEPSLNLGKRNSIQQPIGQIYHQQSNLYKTDSQQNNQNLTIQVENSNLRKFLWNGSSTYWAFDKKQDFLYYFPYHNCKNILRNLMAKIKQQKEKKKILQIKNELLSI